MITEKISNGGILSGTINASSNLTMGIGSSNNLVGGNINTFTKEIDPTIPDYIKAISKEDIAGWDNNAVVNEEQNKTLMGLEELIDIITPKNTKKGELVHITDALNLPTFENKIDGNVEQETTKGNQLVDFENPSWLTNISYDSTTKIYTTNSITGDYKGFNIFTTPTPIIIPKGESTFYYSCDLKLLSGTYSNKLNLIRDGSSYTDLTNNVTQISNPNVSNSYQRYVFKIDYNNTSTEEIKLNNYFLQLTTGVSEAVLEIKNLMISKQDVPYEPYTGGQASPSPEYPQEIEVLESYQLFNKDAVTPKTFLEKDGSLVTNEGFCTTDFIKVKSNEKYYLPNTNTRRLKYYDKNKTALITSDWDIASAGNQIITAPTNASYVRFSIETNVVDTSKFVFSKGTEQKTYLPYGCVGYKVNGKNLLSANDLKPITKNGITFTPIYKENGTLDYVNVNGTATADINYVVHTETRYPINKEKSYFFSGCPSGGSLSTYHFIIYYYDENKGYLGGVYDVGVGKEIPKSSYILANIFVKSGITMNNAKFYPMLSLDGGEYEPYQEQIVPLDLKGNWVGKINDDIKDYLVTDKKKFWLVKTIKRFIVDETHLRGMNNFWYTLVDYLHLPKPEDYIGYNRYTTHDILMDRFYEYAKFTEQETFNAVGSFVPRQGATAIALVFPKGTSLEEAKAKTLGTAVYYKLATPEIIELGELPEPIKTFEGTNNIQVLANLDTEIEVKHALDVKKYADDRYFELTNALVSTGANL